MRKGPPVSAVNPATAAVATPLATVPSPVRMPEDFLAPPSMPTVMESPKALPAALPWLPNSLPILLAKPSIDGIKDT